MTATLRARTEHAARYGANLVVPAVDVKQLLDQLDQAKARIEAVQDVLNTAHDNFENADDAKIRRALGVDGTLPEAGDPR